ncbi:MAG: T9SS type A sorting domain-containing protein, partial [Bacteroidetes bacterium]|nr:T9SS type A sorting domain-containing protein [Bacteroidota bacterium]
KRLFEEMNLSGAAPGMYFVRITADGESFSRKVVVE